MQCHSPVSVGHKKICAQTTFHKNVQCLSLPVGHSKKGCDETTFLKNVQCHSHSVGPKKRCAQTAFHRMCNVSHSLFVIRKDVMRLPFTQMYNVTHFLLDIKARYDENAFHNMCNHSQAIGYKTAFHKYVQCHSLPFGHRKICNETAF